MNYCSTCKYFQDHTVNDDKPTAHGYLLCMKGRQDHIGWSVPACGDYERLELKDEGISL